MEKHMPEAPPITIGNAAVITPFRIKTKRCNGAEHATAVPTVADMPAVETPTSKPLALPDIAPAANAGVMLEEIQREAETIRVFNEKVRRFIPDAVRCIALADKQADETSRALAQAKVAGYKKEIEKIFSVEHPLVREEASRVYALARIECCASTKDAVEDLARELCERGIFEERLGGDKEGCDVPNIYLWGNKTYRPLTREVTAFKIRNAFVGLMEKVSEEYREKLLQEGDELCRRGPLKPSDLLAGRIGFSGFYIPEKAIGRTGSLPSGWLLVELVAERGKPHLYIRDALGDIKRYAQKIMEKGIGLSQHSLAWESFGVKFNDEEKKKMLRALHDWFKRALKHELAQREHELS